MVLKRPSLRLKTNILLLQYILIGIGLLIVILGYFKVADKYNIIDKPNERSSHVTPTIRGGGVIFPLAIVLLTFINGFHFPLLTIAVILTGVISFLDDIKDLPRWLRFGVHAVAAALILYEANVLTMSVVLMLLAFIFVVGMINAFNFMDGINGITGFYSMAVILPLMYTEVDAEIFRLEAVVLIALLVFLFFNARKKARCFAGDVGSVTIAVIICFLLVQRIIATNDFKYLAFLTLYLVDTGLTIIQRAIAKEKIFEAHRRHLFQVFSNEMKIPHLIVAVAYGIIQLLLNWLLINTYPGIFGLVLLFSVSIFLYILIKIRVLRKTV